MPENSAFAHGATSHRSGLVLIRLIVVAHYPPLRRGSVFYAIAATMTNLGPQRDELYAITIEFKHLMSFSLSGEPLLLPCHRQVPVNVAVVPPMRSSLLA